MGRKEQESYCGDGERRGYFDLEGTLLMELTQLSVGGGLHVVTE